MRKLRKLIETLETDIRSRPKAARHISQKLAAKWRLILRDRKRSFDNKAHSMAFEDVVSEEIQRRLGKDAIVRTREIKRVGSLIGIGAEADILIEPTKLRDKPISIISCKITLAPEWLKQSIGEAYALGKLFKRHRLSLRCYFLATHKYGYKSEAALKEVDEFAKVSTRYLHGVYTLTEKPFIDDLLNELNRIYK
jgi:hypothetical protein